MKVPFFHDAILILVVVVLGQCPAKTDDMCEIVFILSKPKITCFCKQIKVICDTCGCANRMECSYKEPLQQVARKYL